ncbi:hypothetical protein LCGC14_1903800 [marine sediment metagenome]|uniref:Uncharacterized protein n=1 Tax=marine sediment metagenome TaxID=412755 RepID=A0A0F9ITU8_9ZZZZ
MNKNANKNIRNNKFNKNKLIIEDISENKKFLINIYNNNKVEIKKVKQYLNNLNHNQKIIKEIINEVK